MTHIDGVSELEQLDSICLIIKVIMHCRPGLLKSAHSNYCHIMANSCLFISFLTKDAHTCIKAPEEECIRKK